ncbi:hypothetical protein NK6_3026 [Bradyrhizobium diazoefficiens]|uniref:Uncharacterized protein n=1 Tax=Bradyrhizobium diazoefficiens TaxID=1355477 RepID=A0A0E4FT06_9BRAD|nr:hypothetical protein NK6_3026 [Bradyrhizobium diazoefficiens]
MNQPQASARLDTDHVSVGLGEVRGKNYIAILIESDQKLIEGRVIPH